MEYIKLINGVKMPILGFGVFQIPEDETEKAVLEALKNGYRLIDTAQRYGNEVGVGKAIKKSGIKREEIFVTTKVWVTEFNYELAKKSIDESLKKLDVDYIDLVLLHQPFNDVYGAWRALREAYDAKKIKAIGVSNFFNDRILDLSLWSGVVPMVNQIELNPFYQRKNEISFQQKMGVAVQSWASFAQGKNDLFNNPTIKKIGDKYNKSVSQVILRWLIQQKVAVIPKSVTPSRIKENIEVFDFKLGASEMKIMDSLDLNQTQFFRHDDPSAVERIHGFTLNKK